MFATPSIRSTRTSRILAAAAVAVAVAGIAPAAHAGGSDQNTSSSRVNVNWLERGSVKGFAGNAHRGYVSGGNSTEGAQSELYLEGMIEHFTCPAGIAPPLFYAWADPKPKTRCTYLGTTTINLDAAAFTFKRDLSLATVKGKAVLANESGTVVGRLPIDLAISGKGRTSVTVDITQDEDHKDVYRYETRSAKVTGHLGTMVVGDESSDRSGGSLDFSSNTHMR